MQKIKLFKFTINFFLFLFLVNINESYCLFDTKELIEESLVNGENQALLNDEDYKKLKSDVIAYLSNSWCSEDKASLIMDFILLEQPKVCVEIGVFTGSSFLPIATSLKFINHGKVFAIDAWSNTEAVKNMSINDPNREWWSHLDMNLVFNTFKKLINDWKLESVTVILAESSENAIHQINENIDFLHMDGNFTEKGALDDVELYLPKVKVGGYILFSNLFLSINNQQPKMKSFVRLLDDCEIICNIDHNNTVLIKKIK